MLLAEAGRAEGDGRLGGAPPRRVAGARRRRLARTRCPADERRAAAARSRASPPASGCARSGCPSSCCSSARSPPRATTSRSSPASGGDRRLANLRKLMRLAREYERAEGRDLRGFLAYAVAAGPRRGARGRGGARVRGPRRGAADDDPPRQGARVPRRLRGRPRPARARPARERLLIGPDGGAGLRLATLAGGDPVARARLRGDRRRARRRRVGRGAAAALRRRDARRGAADPLRRHRHREVAGAAPGRPAARLARPGAARATPPPCSAARGRHGRTAADAAGGGSCAAARARSSRGSSPPRRCRPRRPRRRRASRTAAPGTALPAEPKVIPAGGRPQPAQRRLSYSSLQDYARCPYRFYLGRVLGLPRVEAPPPDDAEEAAEEPAPLEGRIRGSLVHQLLEELDFARPGAARRRRGARARRRLRARARAGPGRGHPRPGRRVRRLAAVRAPRRRARRPARGRLRLRARARRRRPARQRLHRRPRARAPTARCWSSTTRPTGSDEDDTPAALIERAYTTQRKVYALAALQEGAARVEVAYALTERPAEPVAATLRAGRRARARRRAARPRGRRARRGVAGRRAPAPRAVRRVPRAARRCARGPRR